MGNIGDMTIVKKDCSPKIGFILSLFIVILTFGCSAQRDDTLFQVSTINALMNGDYDGSATLYELNQNGDFGIGTFDSLDGEMLYLDGVCYQLKADGSVCKPVQSTRTPFAAVTFFEIDKNIPIQDSLDLEQMVKFLDASLESQNIPYAVKIEGEFSYVKTRSVPRHKKPYRKLLEVIKTQSVCELRNIRGTLVGFRMPAYMEGPNVAGYHFHFITADKKSGGHLLQCTLRHGKAEIDDVKRFYIRLPQSKDFYAIDLSLKDKDIDKVEANPGGD